MGTYTLTRHLSVPPERAYRAFTDPSLVADWMDMEEVRDADGPLERPGTTLTLVVRGPWRFRARIERTDPPHLHVMSGVAPLGGWFRNTAELRSAPDDGTDLSLTTDYRVPLGPVGRLLDRLLIEGKPRTVAEREFDRLVAIVTADQGPVRPVAELDPADDVADRVGAAS